jgi:tetratricopeptide (TPR) repeat protein
MKQIAFLLLLAVLGMAWVACQSPAPVFDDKMKPEDYFQRAQERAEKGDYEGALAYFFKCKEVFPDNLEKNTWASYEIAFLYHRMGNDEKALKLIDELLSLYAQDKSKVLPKAPFSLAQKVRDNIVNQGQYDNKTAKPSPSPAAK